MFKCIIDDTEEIDFITETIYNNYINKIDGGYELYKNMKLWRKCNYKNKLLYGDYIQYSDNGNLYIRCYYGDNEQLTNTKYIYYSNGNLYETTEYTKNYKQGDFKRYYESGNIELECQYNKDKLFGFYYEYYDDENNTTKLTGYFKNDVKCYKWNEYYKNGILKSSCTYENNHISKNDEIIKYYENGHLYKHITVHVSMDKKYVSFVEYYPNTKIAIKILHKTDIDGYKSGIYDANFYDKHDRLYKSIYYDKMNELYVTKEYNYIHNGTIISKTNNLKYSIYDIYQ